MKHSLSKVLGIVGATAVLAISGIVLVAAPAQAHNLSLKGVESCQADGTYTVTWTEDWTNVPAGAQVEAKVITHTPAGTKLGGGSIAPADSQLQLSRWQSHQANGPSVYGVGTPVNGEVKIVFTQTGIPGTATSAGVTVQSDWTDGFNSSDDNGKVTLRGNCTVPVAKDAVFTVSTTPGTCEAPGTLVYGTSQNVTVTGTADGTAGPGSYDVTATAVNGHQFENGDATEHLTGSIPGNDASLCPPPVVDANPAATVDASCGAATVTLTNVQEQGEVNKTASFVVYVDGNFYNAYAVTGNDTQTVNLTFPEDSGDHQVVVRTGPAFGDIELAKATVTSDCIAPQPEPKVTDTEWVNGEYACGDTTVTQTRTETTTPYVLVNGEWVLDTANATSEEQTQTRDLTADEIAALNCPTDTPTPTPSTPVTTSHQLPLTSSLPTTGVNPMPVLFAGGGILLLGAILFAMRRKIKH